MPFGRNLRKANRQAQTEMRPISRQGFYVYSRFEPQFTFSVFLAEKFFFSKPKTGVYL